MVLILHLINLVNFWPSIPASKPMIWNRLGLEFLLHIVCLLLIQPKILKHMRSSSMKVMLLALNNIRVGCINRTISGVWISINRNRILILRKTTREIAIQNEHWNDP
jgi:hypothetical protein